jgi:transcriptional regulator with XRE-family HTH domain
VSNRFGAAVGTLFSMAKTTLPQRLQTVMDAMGWSQADLARAAKTSRQNITNWMTEVSGSKKSMEPRFAWAIEDATRFNARWIVYGEGPSRIELADPADARLLAEISKLPPERKRALSLALNLPL